MAQPPDSDRINAPPSSWKKQTAAVAILLIATVGLLGWWLYGTHGKVRAFNAAIEQRDANRLVMLAPLSERGKVLEQAKALWAATAPAASDASAARSSGACVVRELPAGWLDKVLGHRDLLVVAVDGDTGNGIDVFYFHIRAGRLMAGADPRMFNRLAGLTERLCANPYCPLTGDD